MPGSVGETVVPYKLFSRDWAHGTSVIRLPDGAIEGFVHDPAARNLALEKMRTSIASELKDLTVTIGPSIKAASNVDLEDDANWTCGFDSDSCCAGIYAALEDRPPLSKRRSMMPGMTRAHPAHYMVVKCGAGRSAEEFHSHLQDKLRTGMGLTESLESISTEMTGSPDPMSVLKRLASVGRRNRSRIMMILARALGIEATIDSMLDLAAGPHGSQQAAILQTDTVTNMLELAPSDPSHWLYFGGSVAPCHSQGIALCSNVADGFVLLEEAKGGASQQRVQTLVRNQFYGSLPYGSEMISSPEEALAIASQDHAVVATTDAAAHPDSAWVRRHFAWQSPAPRTTTAQANSAYDNLVTELEPPVLWGTHAPLKLTTWARQLECDDLSPLRLRPELVLLAGGEPASIRSAVKSILADQKQRLARSTEE